jgi:hypothetical protein
MHLKEKELEKSGLGSIEKAQAKTEIYLSVLEELSQKDRGFSQILSQIKSGLSNAVKDMNKDRDYQTKKTDDDKTELSKVKQKSDGLEKIMGEMKK